MDLPVERGRGIKPFWRSRLKNGRVGNLFGVFYQLHTLEWGPHMGKIGRPNNFQNLYLSFKMGERGHKKGGP